LVAAALVLIQMEQQVLLAEILLFILLLLTAVVEVVQVRLALMVEMARLAVAVGLLKVLQQGALRYMAHKGIKAGTGSHKPVVVVVVARVAKDKIR
jgi:uncharacterized integral membrane protein